MFLTYEQQLDLVAKGQARVSVNGKFSTFKYTRKVFYQHPWTALSLERACRGHTYDNTNGNLVTCPPLKTFNYLENNWWKDIPLDTPVLACKKYNGFMAAASIYQGELVVSTTGTTDSVYAKWAKAEIEKVKTSQQWTFDDESTNLFEIVLPDVDPHIVKEQKTGAVYLGYVQHHSQPSWIPYFMDEDALYCTLEDVVNTKDKGEGYMVYMLDSDEQSYDTLNPCKVKTPYYRGKKRLMRLGTKGVDTMYDSVKDFLKTIDPSWEEVVHCIRQHYKKHEWALLDEQTRRAIIEEILGENNAS